MDRERAALLGGFGGPTAIIILLLLFRGDAPPVTSVAAPVRSPSATAVRSVPATGAGFRQGQRLIEGFFGMPWPALVARCAGRRDAMAGVACPSADDETAFRVIVATVPDPYDSYLDWAYDADFDAMRRALATAGYVPHSYWLPGRTDSIEVGGRRVRQRDVQPGVYLFRRAIGGRIGLALLYLVPELPSAGVLLPALEAAFEERRWLLHHGRAALGVSERERQELVMVAPMFSGSAQSIRMALDRELASPSGCPSIARLTTGSATSFGNRALLSTPRDSVNVTPRPPPSQRTARDAAARLPRIEFFATLNTDDALQESLDTLLVRMGIGSDQVVILAESGTEYGFTRSQAGGAAAAADTAVARPTVAGAPAVIPRAPPLVISFPASVAGLRTDFGERLREQQTALGPMAGDAMSRSRVSLADSLRPRERPPVVSRLTESASDVVLSALIRAVSEHNVRVVVIFATDVRDKLWLADEIRRRVRDIVIVTFESNALMLRPEFANAFRGGIVLSSYPLLPENQFWSLARRDSSGRAVVGLGYLASLTSDDAYGVFNATLESLGANPSLRADFRMRGLAPDSTYHRPAVWTSVVGRGALYPLRAVAARPEHRVYFGPMSEPEFTAEGIESATRPHTHGYTILRKGMGFVLLLPCLFVAWLAARSLLVPRRHDRVGQPISLRSPTSSRQTLLTGLLLAVLAVAPLPIIATVGARGALGAVGTAGIDVMTAVETWTARALTWFSLLVGAAHVVGGMLGGILDAWRARQATWLAMRGTGGALPSLRRFAKHWLVALRPSSEAREAVRRSALLRRLEESRVQQQIFQAREKVLWPLAVSAVLTLGVVWFAYEVYVFSDGIDRLARDGGLPATMFVFRALHLTSGVSPLVPLLLMSAGMALWLWWMLRQVQRMEEGGPLDTALVEMAREMPDDARWWRLAEGLTMARRGLHWVVPHRVFNGTVFVILLFILFGVGSWMHTIERLALADARTSAAFDAAITIGLVALPTVVALAVTRMLVTWTALKRFLDEIAATPLEAALRRLPAHLTRFTQLGLVGGPKPPALLTALHEEYWARATEAAHWAVPGSATDGAPPSSGEPLQGTPAELAAAAALAEQLLPMSSVDRVRVNIGALRRAWDALAGPRNARDALAPEAPQPRVDLAVKRSEEFTALHVVHAVEPFLGSLHRLSVFLLLTLLVCVILTVTYPFQPESIFAVGSVMLLVAAIGSVLYVMFDMNRDPVLSSMARTNPGEITWDTRFITNLFAFGVLPLLTFASSQFPALRATLFSWADPLVRVITK